MASSSAPLCPRPRCCPSVPPMRPRLPASRPPPPPPSGRTSQATTRHDPGLAQLEGEQQKRDPHDGLHDGDLYSEVLRPPPVHGVQLRHADDELLLSEARDNPVRTTSSHASATPAGSSVALSMDVWGHTSSSGSPRL